MNMRRIIIHTQMIREVLIRVYVIFAFLAALQGNMRCILALRRKKGCKSIENQVSRHSLPMQSHDAL